MSPRTARLCVMCGFVVVGLVRAWVMPCRTLRVANGNTIIAERGSCIESKPQQVNSQMRHLVYLC